MTMKKIMPELLSANKDR